MAGISYHWPASGLNTGTSLIGSYRLLSVPRGDGEVASVQGSDRLATEQAQRAIEVDPEHLENPADPGLAPAGERVSPGTAGHGGTGAQRDGAGDIGATAKTAVDQ